MTAIQDAAQDIATRVHTTIAAYSKLGVELTTAQALDDVIDERIQNARDARARHGQWQNATSSTDIEDALLGLLHGLVTSELACFRVSLEGCRYAQALPSRVP